MVDFTWLRLVSIRCWRFCVSCTLGQWCCVQLPSRHGVQLGHRYSAHRERSLYGPISGARNGCQLEQAATGQLECCAVCEQHATRVFVFCNEPLFPDIAVSVCGIDISHRILLIHEILTPGWGISPVRRIPWQHIKEKYGKNIRAPKMFRIRDSGALQHVVMRHSQQRPLCSVTVGN